MSAKETGGHHGDAHDDRPRFTDQAFEGLTPGEFDFSGALLLDCTFQGCELDEASFRGSQLSDCRFEGCSLAILDFTDPVCQSVEFETCRLTGTDFSLLDAGPLGITLRFDGCDLAFCSFRKLDLTACEFASCVLREAEFTRCKLEGVSFASSDLARCTFTDNDMVDADLRGARNYVISPTNNRVRGLKAELPEAQGLLVALGVELN